MTAGSRLAGYRARVAAKAADTSIHASDETETPVVPEEVAPEEQEHDMTDTTTPPAPAPVAAAPAPAAPAAPAAPSPASPAPAAAAPDGVARMKAVFASEKVKGHEARAAEMLADSDFDGLSADAILKILGSAPAPVASADDEVAQGREMLDRMRAQGNAPIGTEAKPDAVNAQAKADSIWDKARARNGGQ